MLPAIVVLTLTVFARYTTIDFTGMGIYLYVCLVVFIIAGCGFAPHFQSFSPHFYVILASFRILLSCFSAEFWSNSQVHRWVLRDDDPRLPGGQFYIQMKIFQ